MLVSLSSNKPQLELLYIIQLQNTLLIMQLNLYYYNMHLFTQFCSRLNNSWPRGQGINTEY